MICPECSKEMKDKSYWYYGLGSWDMDYPDCLHEEYRCSCCRISCVNGEWKIPKKFLATEKQINASQIIGRVLGIEAPPPTKKAMWLFINQNMNKSKEQSKQNKISREANFQQWCEDDAWWLPEEYF